MISLHSTFSFVFFLFGFAVLIRILKTFSTENLISVKQKRFLSLIFGMFFVLYSVFFEISALKTLIFIIVGVISIIIYTKFLENRRQQQFFDYELQLVSNLFLKVSSGLSVCDAILIESTKKNLVFKSFRQQLNFLVTFRQQKSEETSPKRQMKTLFWLHVLLDNPINALEKLKAYEDKLQIEHDFRRRSGQTLLGVRIQAAVMILLYLLGTVFVLSFYGIPKEIDYLLLSLLLFTIGIIWIFRLGSKIKWKI